MRSSTAVSKLQAILIIDLIIVALAAGALSYVQSLPGPELTDNQIQFTDLEVEPSSQLVGQASTVLANVTNVGGIAGTYTIRLFIDGEQAQSQTTKLAAGETKLANFTISGASEGTHIVKVGNLEHSFVVADIFALSDLAVNRTEARVGEAIGIALTIKNRAQERSSYTVTLVLNDSTTQTQTGQLEAGESKSILFEIKDKPEGTYEFTVGSLSGSFVVSSAAPPPKPAEFIVANLTIDPEVAQPGENVNVTAKVINVGEASGSYSIDFLVNGHTQGSKTVELTGGESAAVAFTLAENTKGNYTISVGNLTGILSVQEPSKIKLTSMIVRPYEVWAGETVTATIKGTNPGTESSSISLRLKIDNAVVQTKTLTIAAGGEGTVDFAIVAEPLQGGDSMTHIIDVNGMQGGFMVVRNGYHTLGVQLTPRGDAKFTITFPNGTTEEHITFWSAILPEGKYTITMPQTDPTGRITFQSWEDGTTTLAHTVVLNARITVTATYTGGTSCPTLYVWNGTDYSYVTDISNHGWLGYINYLNSDGSITYYRNNPWDYIPLNTSQMQPVNGSYSLLTTQNYNEIFYLDQAYLLAVDHPANTDVYSTMVEQYLDPNYMGKIYTVSTGNLKTPVSAINERNQNVLPEISKIDDIFTSGGNGCQSPEWNNISWNRITLNLGDLSTAKQIKLVVKAIVDWGSADDYTIWLNKFFAQPVPNGTQITPPPYIEVKDAKGNWIKIPEGRQFPLPSDGAPRTYVIDLTGLFPTKDYSLRISNFWNVTFDFVGVDTSMQQPINIQKIDPQAYLYQAFAAGNASATGNFTKYGNVTELVLSEDDMFVIGRQGDAIALQFPITGLAPVPAGMIRDYFFYDACWFKDENGNWGFGFGFTVDPLPFKSMSGFPYLPSESYPNDTAHQNYLKQWNTRTIETP